MICTLQNAIFFCRLSYDPINMALLTTQTDIKQVINFLIMTYWRKRSLFILSGSSCYVFWFEDIYAAVIVDTRIENEWAGIPTDAHDVYAADVIGSLKYICLLLPLLNDELRLSKQQNEDHKSSTVGLRGKYTAKNTDRYLIDKFYTYTWMIHGRSNQKGQLYLPLPHIGRRLPKILVRRQVLPPRPISATGTGAFISLERNPCDMSRRACEKGKGYGELNNAQKTPWEWSREEQWTYRYFQRGMWGSRRSATPISWWVTCLLVPMPILRWGLRCACCTGALFGVGLVCRRGSSA